MSKVHELTIFQINDTHGYLEAHPELVWAGSDAAYPRIGGYARIASLFKQARLGNPDSVLALDNGDTMHGTYPAMVSKGEALVPLLNALKLDTMTAHWEFGVAPVLWTPLKLFSGVSDAAFSKCLSAGVPATDGGAGPIRTNS